MQRKLYLVCYDIPEPKRQRLFRYVVKRLSVSGQYSAYECWLIQSERQKLVNFMLSKAILGEDACAILRVGSVYWQNLPKSPVQHAPHDTLIYIG